MGYQGIPQGVELDDHWRPVTSGPQYSNRQAVLTVAACLLTFGFAAGTYYLWNHLLECHLCFWTAMRAWALGVVTFPVCFWPLLRGIHYSFSYASPRGVWAGLSAYLVATGTYFLYTLGLPAIDLAVWKVFITVPGFVLLPVFIVDVVINIAAHFCVEWHKDAKAKSGDWR